jgi:hypothetical protein
METKNELSHKMTPKFFFLSLGVLVGLIATVTSFLNLAFETLNFKFPDVLNATYQSGYYSYNYDPARMAIATLIIFFPIFLILMRYWKRTAKEGLGKTDSGIRKWMIYLILFLSAIVVAVDLVTLVRYFVAGEITARFIWKVIVALIAAGFVGWYYILELRNKEKILGFKVSIWSVVKSSIIVLALLIWSFSVIGTPGQQRIWRLDDKRVQDLQNIQYQIINYWQQKEKLPATLSDISNPISNYQIPVDPEFEQGKTYEYSVKDVKKLSFELCATFGAEMPKGWSEYPSNVGIVPMPAVREGGVSVSYPYPGPGGNGDSWDHKIGHTCFDRTVDKDMYPPYPKPLKQ